jgi:hypothetical protein
MILSSLRSTSLAESRESISLRAACAVSALAADLRVRSLPSNEALRITTKQESIRRRFVDDPTDEPDDLDLDANQKQTGTLDGNTHSPARGSGIPLIKAHLLAAEAEVHKMTMKAIARSTKHRGMLETAFRRKTKFSFFLKAAKKAFRIRAMTWLSCWRIEKK